MLATQVQVIKRHKSCAQGLDTLSQQPADGTRQDITRTARCETHVARRIDPRLTAWLGDDRAVTLGDDDGAGALRRLSSRAETIGDDIAGGFPE